MQGKIKTGEVELFPRIPKKHKVKQQDEEFKKLDRAKRKKMLDSFKD